MPKTTQQIVGDVQKQLERLGERMGSLGDFVTHLARNFQALGELSRRLTWQIAAMVGAPRFPFKGELYHALSGGKQGKSAVPTEDAGGGNGGGGYVHQTFEQKVAELRALHAERQKLYDADKAARQEEEKDNAYLWEAKKAQTKGEKQAAIDLAKVEADRLKGVPNLVGAGTPGSAAFVGPPDLNFEERAKKARAHAAAMGMDEVQMPAHDPTLPAYRNWVDRMHTRASASTPATVAAAAAPAAATKAGRLARFGSGLAASFRQNSFVAGFLPQAAPYLTALSEAARGVTRAFLGVSAAAQGLISAASPDLWQTFTQSLELFAGRVGQTLIPTFMSLAASVQTAATFFQNLSPSTKEFIGQILKWGLIVAGVTAVVVGLATAVSLLLTPLGLVAAGLTTLGVVLERFGAFKNADQRPKTMEDLEASPELNEAKMEATRRGIPIGPKEPAFRDLVEEKRQQKLKEAEGFEKEASFLEPHVGGTNWLTKDRFDTLKAARSKEDEAGRLGMDVTDIDEWLKKVESGHGYHNRTHVGKQLMEEGLDKGIDEDSPEYLEFVKKRRGELADKMTQAGQDAKYYHSLPITGVGQHNVWVGDKQKIGALQTQALTYSNYLNGGEKNKDLGALSAALMMALPSIKGTAQYTTVEGAYKRTQMAAIADDPIETELKKMRMESLKEISDNTGAVPDLLKQLITVMGYSSMIR